MIARTTSGRGETVRIVERANGRQGDLALRAVGNHYEIISNGVFLMDTRNGESERLLARLALRDGNARAHLLIGGLGVGFSLAEALRSDWLERATVVEIEPKIVEWSRTHLAHCSDSALSDPRVRVVVADLSAWLGKVQEMFDGICLDVDNGPAWTVTERNGALYTDDGLALLRRRLKPGGILAIWSAMEVDGFAERLESVFGPVEIVRVPVSRGEPDIIYAAPRD